MIENDDESTPENKDDEIIGLLNKKNNIYERGIQRSEWLKTLK